MPKPSLTVTPKATTAATVEVKLKPSVRQMVLQRCAEYRDLAIQVRTMKGSKKKPGRMKRIENEIDELFTRENQGKALLDGTQLAGFGLKAVYGKRSVFDKMGFMKKHGLTQADFDEFTTQEDNDPYIKISFAGDEDE
jgi:hypothetical protein